HPRTAGSHGRPAGAGTAPTGGGRGDPWEWPPRRIRRTLYCRRPRAAVRSFEDDPDAGVAVLFHDLEDLPGQSEGQRLTDPLGVGGADARHVADGGLPEGDRHPDVDDVAAALLDLDADLPCLARRGRWAGLGTRVRLLRAGVPAAILECGDERGGF